MGINRTFGVGTASFRYQLRGCGWHRQWVLKKYQGKKEGIQIGEMYEEIPQLSWQEVKNIGLRDKKPQERLTASGSRGVNY